MYRPQSNILWSGKNTMQISCLIIDLAVVPKNIKLAAKMKSDHNLLLRTFQRMSEVSPDAEAATENMAKLVNT